MVKRIAKYGFKSGILPKPRQIVESFKTPAELEHAAKENVGFVDPELVPKGVKAHLPLKARVPANVTIANSAKPQSDNTQKKRADWRDLNASIRRKYLSDSLLTQEAEEWRIMKSREKRVEAEHVALLQQAKQAKRTEATTLTLPTIESFLSTKNQLVTPRTREETKLLKAKRTANRKALELQALETKANELLEVYQSSGEYIVNEEQLEAAINKAFSPKTAQSKFYNIGSSLSSFGELSRQFDLSPGNKQTSTTDAQSNLTKSLFGITSNNNPGLGEVEDAISGATVQYQKVLRDLESQKSTKSLDQ